MNSIEYSKNCPNCGEKTIYKNKISWRGSKHKICVKCASGGYTKDEEKFLIENYAILGRIKCAEKLNRTSFSIGVKTSKMGLTMTITPVDETNNKICGRCHLELNKCQFSKDINRKDGKYPNCKKCMQLDRQNPTKKLNKSKYDAIYVKNKMKTDIIYKLRRALRRRFKNLLKYKSVKKYNSVIDFIGCSMNEFKHHLEKQFKDGMSWDNYGYRGWHIDHIKPCAKFDLTNIDEQRKCFHYTNLQPLWWHENLSKWSNYQT